MPQQGIFVPLVPYNSASVMVIQYIRLSSQKVNPGGVPGPSLLVWGQVVGVGMIQRKGKGGPIFAMLPLLCIRPGESQQFAKTNDSDDILP